MQPVVATVHSGGGDARSASKQSYSDVDDTKMWVRKRHSRWRPLDWVLGTSQGQWTFLLSVATLLVLLGAFLWHLTGGNQDHDDTFRQSLWISWGLFFDPGTQTGIPATDPWYVQFVAVILSIFGFVFNLAVLGLVVEWIRGKLKRFKDVRSRVVANGHVLVLGWGDKTLFLLTELKAAERAASSANGQPASRGHRRSRHIVVLAQRPTFDMEQEVAMHLRFNGMNARHISYREGDPTDYAELEKVSAKTADDVLIMGTDRCNQGSDQSAVQTLLALAAMPDFHGYYHGDVFVEMQSRQGVSVARELLPIAEGIVARHAVNHILVLRSLCSPIGFCYLDMASFKEGQKLFVRTVPRELVDVPFKDVCRFFPEATVVGLRGRGLEHEAFALRSLAPGKGRVLQAGDLLVMLAPSSSAAETWKHAWVPSAAKDAPARAWVKEDRFSDGRPNLGPGFELPRIVLIIGCPSDIADILEIVDSYLAEGSVVYLLSEKAVEQRVELLFRHFGAPGRGQPFKRISLIHKVGPTTCKWTLSELPLSKAECVIILAEHPRPDEPPTASDSRNLTAVITIRGLLSDLGREKGKTNCKVVTELLHPRSQLVVEGNNTVRKHGSFIYTSALETALFAMAAEEKLVYNILMELLTANSAVGHIVALPMHDFVGSDECCSYFELHARVFAACGGILLGWKLKAARYPELNPENKWESRIRRGDSSDVLLTLRSLVWESDTGQAAAGEIRTSVTSQASPGSAWSDADHLPTQT